MKDLDILKRIGTVAGIKFKGTSTDRSNLLINQYVIDRNGYITRLKLRLHDSNKQKTISQVDDVTFEKVVGLLSRLEHLEYLDLGEMN